MIRTSGQFQTKKLARKVAVVLQEQPSDFALNVLILSLEGIVGVVVKMEFMIIVS